MDGDAGGMRGGQAWTTDRINAVRELFPVRSALQAVEGVVLMPQR